MNLEDKISAVVGALEDIKAHDIQVLDTTKLTAMFDRVIIASSDSGRQTRALARSVHDKAAELKLTIIGMEGEESGEWVLVDLGDIVVHVMQPAVREYYNLEELWGGTSQAASSGDSMRTAATAVRRRREEN